MVLLKKIGIAILALIVIQTSTFYTIGENSLVRAIGDNYESYVLQLGDNLFIDIGVISKINLTKKQVSKYFSQFAPYNLKVCKSLSECSDLRETDTYYLYLFDFKTKNPFTINLIGEGEFAKEYGASWESRYIWVFFTWILIEKVNTGIS